MSTSRLFVLPRSSSSGRSCSFYYKDRYKQLGITIPILEAEPDNIEEEYRGESGGFTETGIEKDKEIGED